MRPDENDQQVGGDSGRAEMRKLRAQHPNAQIVTELIRLDGSIAIVRASITLPNAGSATGFGSVDFVDPASVEYAEARALERAADLLGFSSAPAAKPAPLPAAASPVAPAPAPAPKPAPAATFTPEITREPVREPIRDEPAPQPVRTTPPPVPSRPAAASPAPVEDELELADYSWTEFWKWAKTTPFQTKNAVEELIGQPITSLNPAQVRSLMRSKADIA